VDAGQTLAQVPVDIEGNPRPQGPVSDIGAYERIVQPAARGLDLRLLGGRRATPASALHVHGFAVRAVEHVSVSVSYATANGTATAAAITARRRHALLRPRHDRQPLPVQVLGDAAVETD
jgi:hypothetical protein